MADEPRIDVRIYGGQEQQPRLTEQAAKQYTAPAEVPVASTVVGSPLLQAGAAMLQQNNRERANMLESTGAAVTQWMPSRLYKGYGLPEFPVVPDFKATSMLGQVDFVMSKEQEEFFLQSRSPQEAANKLELMQRQRDAYQAMGDNPITSFVVGALDPGYLALDIASFGAARAARLAGAGIAGQRYLGAATAFGTTYAAGQLEKQVVPLSEKEVFLTAMANGALTGALIRAPRIAAGAPPAAPVVEAIDPAFPGAQLTAITEAATQGARRDAVLDVAEDFVGPVQVHRAPANLTRPLVPATGEGSTPVRYVSGEAAVDYIPGIGLSQSEFSALTKDGRVLAINSAAELSTVSPSVRKGFTQVDPTAKAVYLPSDDRVYLIRSNLKEGDDVKGILLHEVGVHMNAERVLGTAQAAKLLDRLEELAVGGNVRAKQAFADVPKNTPLHLVREEALGYYIERNHRISGDSFVQRMLHGVREFLRKVGLTSLKLNESDIIQLVRKSARGGEKAKATSFDSVFPYVWHGSPVRGIDQLDTAFIGSGEGRQAFGWGHYVTSEKGTALDYRNKESARRGIDPEEGGLYRVKINAEQSQFLNLDSAAQSPEVAAALTRLEVPQGLTGAQAYQHLEQSLGSAEAASKALRAEGVVGNRYATGRTRMSDVQSSNYVVFDNADVDMAARYSRGLPSLNQAQKEVAKVAGKAISWSLHKTLGSYSTEAKRIADMLVDDPLTRTGNSVANQQRAIRADLEPYIIAYEDQLKAALAESGYGTFNRITRSAEALKVQQAIEREVGMEMLRRNELNAAGMPITYVGVNPQVKAMADSLDDLSKAALAEMKRSGVSGAANVAEASGYFHRRWDWGRMDNIAQALIRDGATPDQAKATMIDMLGISIQRANGWTPELARDIATATYSRARAKGYFEDSAFRKPVGEDATNEIRAILSNSGISGARQQRVLDVLSGQVDEAGKAPTLKHRIEFAMDESITLRDGTKHSIADMIDMNMLNTSERYLDSVSANAAFARKGLTTATDVLNLRKEFLESIPEIGKREQAAALFDNTIAALRGAPVGEELPRVMRMGQAVTQMVGLARAGLFQFTEYASTMAQYGGLRTMASAFKEMPFLRSAMSDPKEAEHLRNVLVRNASADMRIRPYIQRMEDNFEVPISDSMQLSMQQAKQLVPYLNALKYVQNHQARTAGNLIVNTVERAAAGEIKAVAVLQEYGLELHSLQKVKTEIGTHGMDTAKWSDDAWDGLRAPITRMMDDAVLRNRTGEIPAFAQFTSTGKFIFTFRSFVLGAHNKVLAGSLHRSGFDGLGLLMLYQFPLTFMMTATDSAVIKGKKQTDAEIAAQAFGQMGSLGLFSELVGIATGNKQQFGSPGTIALDRLYKIGAAVRPAVQSGSYGDLGAAALGSVPLLSIILPVKAIGENLRDNKE